mgnify:CR=1 FL=1
MTERDQLFLLRPGFADPDYPGDMFYCWHCALMAYPFPIHDQPAWIRVLIPRISTLIQNFLLVAACPRKPGPLFGRPLQLTDRVTSEARTVSLDMSDVRASCGAASG